MGSSGPLDSTSSSISGEDEDMLVSSICGASVFTNSATPRL